MSPCYCLRCSSSSDLRTPKAQADAPRPIKASTGITGLAVHPDPLPALKSVYTATLSSLSSLPSTSVYRQATEALTKHRLSAVESASGDYKKVESAIGSQVEQMLEEAEGEKELVSKMVEWKS